LLEGDEEILESYAKSWTSDVLDKAFQQDCMSFTIARHMASFSSAAVLSKCEISWLNRLSRCYAQKRHRS
ncbi:Os06g0574332, partial [Oryza sativa Japonica Group]